MPHKTDDPLAQLLAAKSSVRKQAGGAVKAAKKLAPGEQKMLQGFYRGFAGEFDTPTVSRETGKIFVSPQKAVGEHYARRRAMQAGSEPHLEMILADPFAGRGYGHAPATTARERTLSTVARQLAPEDIADIYQFYAGGGLARKGAMAKAREIVSDDLFHGGDIKRGDLIDRPLFMTPSREMAQSYADFKSKSGNVQMFRPQIKKPAPERLVNAAARRYVPENEASNYSPASAFDRNLHDPMKVQALIDELERRGYDAAVATDIGMGGQGAIEAPAVVRFPGQRAYAGGGPVIGEEYTPDMSDGGHAVHGPQAFEDGGRVTPEHLHGTYPAQPRRPEKYDFQRAKASLGRVPGNIAEFVIPEDLADVAMYAFPFGKIGKVLGGGMIAFNPGEAEAGKVDTARRALLGLRGAPESQAGALVPTATRGLAPTVEQQTTRLTSSPTAPSLEQTIEKISATPTSRRSFLKTAGSQAVQQALPANVMKMAESISPLQVASGVAKAKKMPTKQMSLPALIAKEFGKYGDDVYEADIDKIIANVVRKSKAPEKEVSRITYDMGDVLGAGEPGGFAEKVSDFAPHLVRPSDVAKLSFGIDPVAQRSPYALRPFMREMKSADPQSYQRFKEGVKDFTMTQNEAALGAYDMPFESATELEKQFLRGGKSYEDVLNFFKQYYE